MINRGIGVITHGTGVIDHANRGIGVITHGTGVIDHALSHQRTHR
jgi:hypothetical protein